MKRALKILGILILAAVIAAGGYFAGKGEKLSGAAVPDNAIWISAKEVPTAVAGSAPALEAEYLAAKATALSLQLSLESAKHAIEEALPMVQEQKDNYDFAEERYNRLMPLVEKGTLDLMTASQIQSAYISARASLSQAKFYLGQAQREYGTPETRQVLMHAAESKAEAARQQMEVGKGAAISGASSASGSIFTFLTESAAAKVTPGSPARMTLRGHDYDVVVRQISGEVITLDLAVPPKTALPIASRCRVTFLSK